MDKTIFLKPAFHKGKNRLMLNFSHDPELISIIKTLGNALWSQTNKSWHIPNNEESYSELQKVIDGKAKLVKDTLEWKAINNSLKPRLRILSKESEEKTLQFKYWLKSRRYSETTIKTYVDALRSFLRFYAHKTIKEIDNNDIILYNNDYIIKNKLSASYQNQVVNAIKLFFREIENTSIDVALIHRPKRPKLLPNVLSKEEVKLILNAHANLKHRAMLSLIYSCGLRCSELLSLKPEHVDSKRNILIIKQAKGRKDRIAPLSSKIIELLREYYIASKPAIFLFEGQVKGQPYDARSLQQVLKQALEKVKITKPASLHWLRHSYATHLLENGTDLRYIQEILGHRSSKTTEIYTHVSTKNIQKIVSPFDYL